MVWNEDLAKLKQQLKAQEPKDSPPQALPKPSPPPTPKKSMAEEDAAFLSAMGVRRPVTSPPIFQGIIEPVVPMVPAPRASIPPEEFSTAMSQLGGVKTRNPDFLKVSPANTGTPNAGTPALPGSIRDPQPAALEPLSRGMLSRPPHLPPDFEPDAETVEIPPPAPQGIRPRPGPLLIHLAAGMAVDVDAFIDLRGHSINDAKERLRERIADGLAMGWRTLHVHLGAGEALKQGFLAFLISPAASSVQRYAQAPVPMGGPQAWILYLGVPGA